MYKNPEELRPIVQKVLDANPKVVDQYKKGNKKVIGLFMKEVFDETLDGADPILTQQLIESLITREWFNLLHSTWIELIVKFMLKHWSINKSSFKIVCDYRYTLVF